MQPTEQEEFEFRLRMEQEQEAEQDKPSQLGVAARAAGQGLAFGFGDEAVAAAKAPFSDKSYTELRDENRAALERDREAFPKTAIGSEIAGAVIPSVAATLLSGPAGGGASVANAGRLASVAKSVFNPATAKALAAGGAAYGLGSSEADLTKGEVGGAAWDATKGAGTALALGRGLPAVAEPIMKAGGKVLRGAGEALSGPAELMASKAAGLTKAFKNKFKITPEQARATGRVALDEGVVGPMSDADDMLQVVQELNERIGPEIGKMLKDAEKRGIVPDFKGMIERLEAEAAPYGKTDIGRSIYNQYQKVIRDLRSIGGAEQVIPAAENVGVNIMGTAAKEAAPTVVPGTPGSIGDLADYKKVVQKVAYPQGAPKVSNEGAIAGYSEVSRGLENVMDEGVPDGPFKEVYRSLKQKYGAGSRMEMALEKARSAADDAPSFLRHPIDAATKKLEQYVQPAAAVTMDRVSKLLQRAPQALGQFGPVLQQAIQRGGTSFATTNFLLQQRDPEYRKKMEELSNMKEGEDDGSEYTAPN